MSTVRFTNLNTALTRAKERCDGGDSDETYLTELLTMSAGTETSSGQTCYRPFYVAARFLLQARRDQGISEADGAKFTGMIRPIIDLLQLQIALDEGLDIPTGFESLTLLDSIGPETRQSHRYTSAVANIKVTPVP